MLLATEAYDPAGIGAGVFVTASEAFWHMRPLRLVSPNPVAAAHEGHYQHWKNLLLQRFAMPEAQLHLQ